MSSYYRQQMEEWLKTIDVNAKAVVDIGGSQNPVWGRTKSWKSDFYGILDLENPHVTKQEPDIVFDIQSESHPPIFEFYDVAFCLEVMEYVINPTQVIHNIDYLLKRGGMLYITFPFIYPHHNPLTEDCLRYTVFGAMKILQDGGFEVKEVSNRHQMGVKDIREWFRSEKMHPAKEYANHDDIGYCITAQKL